MKSRFLVPAVVVMTALLAFAPGSSAISGSASTGGDASSYIKVTTTYEAINRCYTAPNIYGLTLRFKATIKRRGTSRPRKVSVRYTVDDLTTGERVKTESLTLRPRSYRKTATPVTMLANHSYLYKYKSTYRAPNTGRNVTARATETVNVPDEATLAAQGFPACAVG